MINVNTHNQIISKIIKSLLDNFQENLITIFGIGSFFNSDETKKWLQSDIDIIVVLKSLDGVPTKNWTNIKYDKIKIEDVEIWVGFTSIDGLMDKKKFVRESFANYEWSIIDLKYEENSEILYGKDIRKLLPEASTLQFDYDDILARSLYHLNKSFDKIRDSLQLNQRKIELTKAIFKFGFYLCLLYDPLYHFTSIHQISHKLDQLPSAKIYTPLIQNTFKEAMEFRINNQFSTNFKTLRNKFALIIFSLISTGRLHKNLTYTQYINYLKQIFGGLYNIVHFLKKAKNLYFSTEDS